MCPFLRATSLSFTTFQLKAGDAILEKAKKPIVKMEMELLYKDDLSKTIPFPFSHMTVSLNLPKDVFKESLKVEVLDFQGKLIYSAPILKEDLREWF